MAVELSDSEEDIMPDESVVWFNGVHCHFDQRQSHRGLALTDRCCARTVAGMAGDVWARRHLRRLRRAGVDAYVIP